MRAVFGLLLVMLGLAMAVVWMPERDGERQLAVVTDIATQGMARSTGAKSERGGRTFSPDTPLLAVVDQPATRQPHHTAGVARVVPAQAAPVVVFEAPAVQATSTSSVVTGTFAAATADTQRVATVGAARPIDGVAQPRSSAPPEMSRYELVRSIQRELKRVGCYAGDVDGDWGAGSRRAMASFTDRVNAALPIDQPDFILLTLLQGHQGGVCGRGCPSGQTMADSGRCLPNAVTAQARSGRDRRHTASAAPAAAGEAGWSTSITRAPEQSTSVGAVSAAAVATGAAVAAATATPLPGRMAIGGPAAAIGAGGTGGASPALAAVRGATAVEPAEPVVRSGAASASRRERGRRLANRATPRRQAYTASFGGYRAPQIVTPRYYASAPRRSATSRSWTATFFPTH